MKRWQLVNTDADLELMSKILKIHRTTGRVIANRNIRTKKTALRYLRPELSGFFDSCTMKDMKKAVYIVLNSIKQGKRVAIYGDYDADGVMSTVILYKTLRSLGADVTYYIPAREEEGYGLNKSAVESLREDEADLILTCDNGITALEEVAFANSLGMEVVIIDHHEPGYVEAVDGGRLDVVPDAAAVVDPKQQDCPYPFKHLCAAGLSYKFAMELYKGAGRQAPENGELLILASIATICDIVDLLEENRIIAKHGLSLMQTPANTNLGLKALMRKRGLGEKAVTTFDIGFIIGPCINATGRLDSAGLAVELFLTEDTDKAEALADKLVELNEERKTLTTNAAELLLNEIEKRPGEIDKVLVLYNEEIHESIAGIVAGRIKEAYYHPAIVLTKGMDCVKGSARSIEGYNIFEALYSCRDLFERFGGHAMAAGLSLKKENIPLLRSRLNEACLLKPQEFTEILCIDEELSLDQATYELASQLKWLEPFGKANKEPLFMTKGALVEQLRIIEDKNTMIFSFAIEGSYRGIKGICFGQEKLEDFWKKLHNAFPERDCEKIWAGILRTVKLKLDIAYSLDINEYNNTVSVQLRLKDFKIST